MEREVIQSIKIKSTDLHGKILIYLDDLKDLYFNDEKAAKADSFNNKMKSWVNRQLKKLGV